MRPLLAGICLLVTVSALGSCSGTQAIARAANKMHAKAEAIRSRSREVAENLRGPEPDVPAAADAQDENVKDADAIIGSANAVHEALPKTRDVVPWWATFLVWGAVGVVLIAAIVLLWQTGAGRAIRAIFGLIPVPVRREAELAAAAMDPAQPESVRELVAARRARDPLYDKAFAKANARLAAERGRRQTTPAAAKEPSP